MKINHLGIAVRSIDDALKFYADALGLTLTGQEVVEEQGVRVAFLPVGPSRIELLEAIDETSPVAKFIAKRGEGIHHICLEVEDIEAKLRELKAAGVRLIDEAPRAGAGGHKIAFVHPASAHGVLIELTETREKEANP
jgi:lactoylglutathione lyase/methylmalonyl-CoA/ethylmalonyl-CoA epimerase